MDLDMWFSHRISNSRANLGRIQRLMSFRQTEFTEFTKWVTGNSKCAQISRRYSRGSWFGEGDLATRGCDLAFLDDDLPFLGDDRAFLSGDRAFLSGDRAFLGDDRAFLSDD